MSVEPQLRLRSSTVVDVIGADSVIDYTRQEIDGDGNRYDVILDLSSCPTAEHDHGN